MLRRALVLIFGSLLPARAAQCPPNAAPFTAPSAISDAEQLKYADLFTVVYHPTYKVIKYNPTQGKFQSGWPNPSLRNQRIPDLVLYQSLECRPAFAFRSHLPEVTGSRVPDFTSNITTVVLPPTSISSHGPTLTTHTGAAVTPPEGFNLRSLCVFLKHSVFLYVPNMNLVLLQDLKKAGMSCQVCTRQPGDYKP